MTNNIIVSSTAIDNYIWAVRHYLMTKYGIDEADRNIYPLVWYINTCRASTPFLKALLSSKTFMIARICHNGGSDDDVIQRIKAYLHQ